MIPYENGGNDAFLSQSLESAKFLAILCVFVANGFPAASRFQQQPHRIAESFANHAQEARAVGAVDRTVIVG